MILPIPVWSVPIGLVDSVLVGSVPDEVVDVDVDVVVGVVVGVVVDMTGYIADTCFVAVFR